MSENTAFDAMLEEYKSLRAESLNAILQRNQISGLSFTALSIMISAASIAKFPNVMGSVLFVLWVPSFSKAISLIWLGEYERSKRAGAAIEWLEVKINRFVKNDALAWEHDLAKKNISMTYPYIATLSIMLGAGYASLFISANFIAKYLKEDLHVQHPYTYRTIVMLAALSIELCYIVWFEKKWRSARSRYQGMFRSTQAEQSMPTKAKAEDIAEQEQAVQ